MVWIREEIRVRAQRNSTMRRRLQWCGYVRRLELELNVTVQ